MANESNITINGYSLTQGQIMTIKVALNNFIWDFKGNVGVGLGFKLREKYRVDVRSIQDYMHINQEGENEC